MRRKNTKSNSDVFSMRCGDVTRKRQLSLLSSSDIKELLFMWLDMMSDGTMTSYKVLFNFELEHIQHEIDVRKDEIEELEQLLEHKREEFEELCEVMDKEAIAMDELWELLCVAHFEQERVKSIVDIERIMSSCLVDDISCVNYCLKRLEQYRQDLLKSHPIDTEVGRDKQWQCDWLRRKLEYMLTDDYVSLQG